MPHLRFTPPGWRTGLPVILALLALTACESERASRRERAAESNAPEPDHAVPDMEAHGMFFAGGIEVEVLLNRAGFAGRNTPAAAADSGGSSSGRFGGGGRGGGGMRGGGRGAGGGESSAAESRDDGTPAPHIFPSNLPAVRLHLRLTNHGSSPVEVEVPDFNSDLGDFVVEPPKIQLPPNQPVEAEPMTSRLGITSEQIPLTVSLASGGRTETQVLALRMVKPAEPAVTPTPAATAPAPAAP